MKKNNESKLQFGLAQITPEGLLFEERSYTNEAMIRCGWFEHASIYGAWEIPILFHSQIHNEVLLFDLQSIEVATSTEVSALQDSRESHLLNTYQDNLQELILIFQKHEINRWN
ncbi:hypothetical protein [Paenibacillus eucommiae]|uniref:Uncharacterized protein n=1 Tax=Paenibacillus eucommiae TaxID=1355755 RepID=A0ABS4IW09_9BACL|nr:hypothetical protein [Paenibacillus eucommiae]MBP1991186.1 hypothetical protein [Paenibacillus eucommiae]